MASWGHKSIATNSFVIKTSHNLFEGCHRIFYHGNSDLKYIKVLLNCDITKLQQVGVRNNVHWVQELLVSNLVKKRLILTKGLHR